jgi:uncharacterized integral membrane protein (TIGR00698 family)
MLAFPVIARLYAIPTMVIALAIGMALSTVASRPAVQPGIQFCVRTLLRWSVALLGLRIALAEIISLGAGTAAVVVIAMASTIAAGVLLARLVGEGAYFGALAGAGTAVCGASATLATSAVLPDYKGKEIEVAFVVIAVNALSTLAMLLYPALCRLIGFEDQTAGAMLGATIHDVAQVAGAGYAVSEPVGNAAVVVKLFRVLLLFPVIVAIAWWVLQPRRPVSALRSSVPGFALVFLALCLVNSLLSAMPAVAGIYQPIKSAVAHASSWGLLIAIGALGLGTSISAVAVLGWRHLAIVVGTTLVILAIVVAGLLVTTNGD